METKLMKLEIEISEETALVIKQNAKILGITEMEFVTLALTVGVGMETMATAISAIGKINKQNKKSEVKEYAGNKR